MIKDGPLSLLMMMEAVKATLEILRATCPVILRARFNGVLSRENIRITYSVVPLQEYIAVIIISRLESGRPDLAEEQRYTKATEHLPKRPANQKMK